MTRALLATLALIALTGMSQAEPIAVKTIKPFPIYYPPPEFDRPYSGALTITSAKDTAEVQKACGNVPAAMGCSVRFPDRCTIILAPEPIIKAYGWTEQHVIRHETAHCNGWHHDHRGWRRADR